MTNQSAKINSIVFKYIKSLLNNKNEFDIIKLTKAIGYSPIDKIICLANLFFICVKQDKISLMQIIIDSINEKEKEFIINAYDRDYTPLMQAAYYGSFNSLKLLLIWGADVNSINIHEEDVTTAAKEGLKNSLKSLKEKKQESLEILVKPKYDSIIDYIQYWKDNLNNPNKDNIFINEQNNKYKIIDIESDILSQIETILQSCIDDCKIKILTELFLEINNLMDDKLVLKKDIINIINEVKDILEDEYTEQLKIINL